MTVPCLSLSFVILTLLKIALVGHFVKCRSTWDCLMFSLSQSEKWIFPKNTMEVMFSVHHIREYMMFICPITGMLTLSTWLRCAASLHSPVTWFPLCTLSSVLWRDVLRWCTCCFSSCFCLMISAPLMVLASPGNTVVLVWQYSLGPPTFIYLNSTVKRCSPFPSSYLCIQLFWMNF